ncbi:MAG: NAD(P)-dependent oxidoreductase [Candidatus Woesearchaeota archaeon]
MATIAFFDVHEWEKPYLKKKLSSHRCLFFTESFSQKFLPKLKNVDALSVFVHSQVPTEDILQLPKLKLVALRSTGFDNIDVKACADNGIVVCNVPFYGENTVAEHTFAMLLSISRRIHEAHVRVEKKNFQTDGLTGFDLKGKTIGVIGGGHIGMHVVKMARAFDMKVLVYDIFENTFLKEVLGFEYAKLPQLLQKSDIITCHAPYNPHTHHIINEKNISKVKKGAVFLNTARGPLIDTNVLLKALEDGTFSYAGLDVLEGEELLTNQSFRNTQKKELQKVYKRNSKICHLKNVLFTPHNAFNSQEALERILDTTVQNITTGLRKKYQNVVRVQ